MAGAARGLVVCVAVAGPACSHDWARLESVAIDDCTLAVLPDPRAGVVHVAPDGDDAQDGARERPVQRLGRAVALLGGHGGTIFLGPGTYPPQPDLGDARGLPDSKLRIRPERPGTVKIGSLHFASAAHLIVDGLEVFGELDANGAPATAAGIVVDKAGVTDLTVRGCTFHDLSRTAIEVAGDGLRYEDNTLERVLGQGNTPCLGVSARVDAAHLAHDVVVRNNRISGCQNAGVGIRYGEDVVVEDNVIERSDSGILLDNCRSASRAVIVRRNLVRQSSPAIVLQVSAYGSAAIPVHNFRVENNLLLGGALVWWKGGTPDASFTYADVFIRHNTIVNDGDTLGFSGTGGAAPATGCEATNNVFVGSPTSTIGNPDLAGWRRVDNYWSSSSRPNIASADDVVADGLQAWAAFGPDELEAHAHEAKAGSVPPLARVPPLETDFFCQRRSLDTPMRGAIEAAR